MLPLLPLVICQSLIAQTYFYNDRYLEPAVLLEGGLGAGPLHAFTDLGRKKGLPATASLYMPLYLQAEIAQGWSLRLQAGFGRLQGADSTSTAADGFSVQRLQRNLQFRSPLTECSLLNVWEPLSWIKPDVIHVVNPVLLAGFGYFHFDPKAFWQQQWIRLAPLHTEGQGFAEYPLRKPYSLHQFNLQFGAGLRLELHARWMLRTELIYRHLFTDYLDDVSTEYINLALFSRYLPEARALLAQQLADRRIHVSDQQPAAGQKRGNPSRKDSYAALQVSAGYILNRRRR